MRVLKASEMAFADDNTIRLTGIPSLVLMENAGRTASQIILNRYSNEKNFVVIAGSGNNGGDGIVIARYLLRKGKNVKVFVLSDNRSKLSQDNLRNLEIFESLGGEAVLIGSDKLRKLINAIKEADVVVDGIFGTGFKPPVRGYREKAIQFINKYGKNIVSVDIPSGLSTDTGKTEGSFVKADLTITFAYPKIAHILYPSSLYCGEVFVVDISIDDSYLKEIKRFILTPEILKLPERKKNSHKYTYGHTLIVGGSTGKTGAVIMSAKASTAAGSGLTTVCVPKSLNVIFETSLTEEMSIPVDDEDGFFGKKAYRQILEIIKNGKFTSVVVGMGMSVKEYTLDLVENILKVKLPLVIDADGLNNLSIIDNFKEKLRKRKFPTVLTPHIGEMSRLTGIQTKDINENMEDVAKEFSKETGVFTVLKSSRTVIATPEGKVFYSTKGNEGMATAGTGDVLSGILGTLIYRLGVEEGTKTGVYIHGLAGELASFEKGVESMKATDIIDYVGTAYEVLKDKKSKFNPDFYTSLSDI